MWREGIGALAAAIRGHPQYLLASRRYMAEFVALRANIGVVNKVMSNLGRERIFEHLLYLHFAGDAVASNSGASFERLASLSESRDQIGARAVRTALRLAQTAGLVVPVRSRQDARLRIYEPTESLVALTRDYSVLAFQVLDRLSPELRLAAQMRDNLKSMTNLLVRMGATYLVEEPRPHVATDVLTSLLRLEGGRTILAVVIDCHARELPLPTSQDFARRFYVSPSQSRAILKQAQTLGLIRTAARGQVLDAQPLAKLYMDALSRYLAFAALYGLGMNVDALGFEKRA
jgi:hypothetical protein